MISTGLKLKMSLCEMKECFSYVWGAGGGGGGIDLHASIRVITPLSRWIFMFTIVVGLVGHVHFEWACLTTPLTWQTGVTRRPSSHSTQPSLTTWWEGSRRWQTLQSFSRHTWRNGQQEVFTSQVPQELARQQRCYTSLMSSRFVWSLSLTCVQ